MMGRGDNLARLSRVLSKSYFVVQRPDIPYLLEGPDLLASQTGRLLAIFLPKAREYEDWRRLAARLILSRLALPANTTTLLVIPTDRPSNAVDQETIGLFSAATDNRELSRAVDKTLVEQRKPVPAHVRGWALERASFLTALARRPETGNRLVGQARPLAVSPHADFPLTPPDLWRFGLPQGAVVERYQRAYIAFPRGKGSVASVINPYSSALVNSTFSVIGEAIEIASPELGAIYLQDRRGHIVTSRESRGTALAGWALLDDRLPPSLAADLLNSWLARLS